MNEEADEPLGRNTEPSGTPSELIPKAISADDTTLGEAATSEPSVDGGAASEPAHDFSFRRAAARVREFPQKPGVYLMKDSAGRVIYVGKATNLRSRAGSYFSKQAAEEPRTSYWVHEICDADFIECDSEVDALLVESRLIKDTQPKYNKEQKDDKTFPYLMITTR
ncbi:MAG: GIY-YIG nuclease family protein, partial [Planctomycetales bacterium]|nr:GIY-YIG nuclease family protein [Planctomycetales bacterium]